MDVETCCRRLLSPFHGMLQVVEVSGGVAERFDGLHWQTSWLLQLADLDPDSRASLERAAWERPLATGKAFHLYPVVLGPGGTHGDPGKGEAHG